MGYSMIKLSFGRPENYDVLLNQLFIAALLFAVLVCYWLRTDAPHVDTFQSKFDFNSNFEAVKDFKGIQGGGLLSGIIVAVFFES